MEFVELKSKKELGGATLFETGPDKEMPDAHL